MTPYKGCLTLLYASIVFGACSVSAMEPSAVQTLSSGELVILNITGGIEKVSATNVRTRLVKDFGSFEAGGFTIEPMVGGDAIFVSLRLRFNASGPLARLTRYDSAGKKTAEWYLHEIGGVLADIAIDSAHNVAYCSDSRLNIIYKLDLNNVRSTFVRLIKIHGAGILGPMVIDTKRQRLLIADVEKGRVLSVRLDTRVVEVALESGTVAEPVAMVWNQANDRLYILDASRKRVLIGTPLGSELTIKTFSASQKFKEPISLASAGEGSLWVVDRGHRQTWLFDADGRTLRTITP